MKGRKPTPTAVLEMTGQRRRDRHANEEPQPELAAPEPPDCLNDAALDEWNRVCGELLAMRTLARVDMAMLAGYAASFARWREAERTLNEVGAVVRTAGGAAAINPWFSIAQRSLKELRAYAAELGLSATSRARLRVSPDEPDDDLEQFKRGVS